MNKYIQEFLEKRKENEKKLLERKVQKIIQNLEIGEKVYGEKFFRTNEEFPNFDKEKGMPFKYDIGDATKEEYELLLKEVSPTNENKIKKTAVISEWYLYAKVMLIVSAVGLLILAKISISEKDAIYFFVGAGEFIMFSLFCAIVQLLAGIKQGIDNLVDR